jgi:hypothetical protein
MPETTPSTAPVTPVPTKSFGRRLRNGFLTLVALLLVAVALYIFVALRFSYSSGDRAGIVQKFSHKGWVCKTWEGELAMTTLPGVVPQIFTFTVRDDAVAERISATMGQKVVLKYDQHPGLPSCFGETSHFVTSVRSQDETP